MTKYTDSWTIYVKLLSNENNDDPTIIVFNSLVDILRYCDEFDVDFENELRDAREHLLVDPTGE